MIERLRTGRLPRWTVLAVTLLLTGVVPADASAVETSTVESRVAGVGAADPCVGADCGVVPDPDDAAYVGTGGLLLPSSSFTGSDEDRTTAALCEGCQWGLALMCRGDRPHDLPCNGAATSCPTGQVRYIVLLWTPENPQWRQVGLVCLGPEGPTTVADAAASLRDRVVEQVPPLLPSVQPAGRTLVQLPTLFASGQPATLGERRFDLVGFEIVLSGRATWEWSFGDGSGLTTSEPGGSWPEDSVSHVYQRPGLVAPSVTSTWEAWFTVDGMGPFRVGGDPVVQNSPTLELEVLQARAELIAG